MSSWRSTIILLSPSEPRNLSWSLRVDGSNGIRKDFNHANPGGPYLAPSVAHESFQKRSARAYFQAQAFTWSVPSSFTSTSNAPIVSFAGASFCELVQYWAAPRMLAFQPAPVGQPTPCPLKLTDSPPFVKK